MASKAELEQRIISLEQRVRTLESRDEMFWRVYNDLKENIDTRIEKYVQEHIWYTNCENLQAYEKGKKLRVLLKQVEDVMDPTPEKGRKKQKKEN